MNNKIFVTGGAGYVGSALVPELLKKGYFVTVLDLMIYGRNVLKKHKNLKIIRGDIRNIKLIKQIICGHDIVIHLACISNDPSFELNPKLGKTINLDAFEPIVKICKLNNVKRFIYASSSSVYGIKKSKNVHEKMKLKPLTDYSKYKAKCEKILNKYSSKDFVVTTIRPATVCGYAKRQRLDVVVNILSNLAYHKREITIFGGSQLRPNIHIKDMVRVYLILINAPSNKINKEIFNVGGKNQTVVSLANDVKKVMGDDIKLKRIPSNDKRSYHISSSKILNKLGFKTRFTVSDAVKDLKRVFEKKKLINPIKNINYFNILTMQKIKLK
ncbi:MAG: UDP-glucose 4-epimerase [Candidatus Marinimicrobia bacterium]|nr:UDP-glucose 4-epimerase [Candidatus Neomarinimicrobiota bacterium]|tara:strand:- start:1851 stop:2834 length:984 start_codon:yes stop_codon:yes gene_type:complete